MRRELMKKGSIALIFILFSVPATLAQATRGLEIKYVRDSAEYATLTRMIYRMATDAVTKNHPSSGAWGVILDVDETTLDNSLYQIERGIYGLGYDDASWAMWVARAEAGTVPGVKEFLDTVRNLKGKVVFITDRNTEYVAPDGSKIDLVKATRDNLDHNGLLGSGDLVCLKTNADDKKPMRRKAV